MCAGSEARDRVAGGAGRGGAQSRAGSSKAASRDPSRPPSAIENNVDLFREPVVKSPPEPTRVRSPEQLMMRSVNTMCGSDCNVRGRSPDPINWTVPLDTGKTFQVTQSVRENGKESSPSTKPYIYMCADSARNSPMSDHSSHFDSVSGTAINLGLHSVNDKGGLNHPKVSALAREAKELQGRTANKKDEKVEAGPSEGEAATAADLRANGRD